ncbi:MAG: peptidylprolyl isomerase [Nitrospinae bacterium]|nr:peptidylprolyl isomerase [Nitrospinota bacterium]MBL7021648.1 peptidylprolyl isomerase [Nitrospinaceae bacterium]
MARFVSLSLYFILFGAGLLISANPAKVWAHSGHKHDELKIKLPKVVAQVNGENISGDVISRELKKAAQQYKKRGMPLNAEQEKSAAKKLIDDEIGRTLLVLKAKESGITITTEMMEKRIKEVKAKFRSDAIFEHKLTDQGLTLDQYKAELETDLYMDQIIKKEIEPKIKVPEKEILDYYEKNKNKFTSPEKVRASIILLKFNPSQGKAGEQKILKKFESILDQLRNGTDFSAMARKFSQDSLAPKGGDLGFFTRKQMLPAFSNRAFKMKKDEISDIFRTGHGFHVLKVTDKKSAGTSPFADEKEKIMNFLSQKKSSKATQDYIEALKEQAKIKIYF